MVDAILVHVERARLTPRDVDRRRQGIVGIVGVVAVLDHRRRGVGRVDVVEPVTGRRDAFCGCDDQVALAAGGHVAGFSTAMAVGSAEAGNRQARHEECLEHAVVNEVDALGLLAFVVELITAAEPGAAEGVDRGVVGDGEEVRKNRLADVLGEGLALLVAALALALKAMAENFVEENRGGAAGENGRTVKGFSDRSFAQRLETLAEIAHGRCKNGLRGKAVDGFCLEGLFAEEIHAVIGAGNGDGDDPRLQMR